MMSVRVSVIVCTVNRPELLRKAIRSLVDQTLDATHYEILVVDNGSANGTRRVPFEEFDTVRNLHHISESVQGLSRARNAGWRSAAGEYVAYLDDDATADARWIETLLHRFERGPADGIGGPIDLGARTGGVAPTLRTACGASRPRQHVP